MKNILLLLTVFIAITISACFDDKGNYDYHEINELQITGLPTELQVKYRNAYFACDSCYRGNCR